LVERSLSSIPGYGKDGQGCVGCICVRLCSWTPVELLFGFVSRYIRLVDTVYSHSIFSVHYN
jgi:hypothetical protein